MTDRPIFNQPKVSLVKDETDRVAAFNLMSDLEFFLHVRAMSPEERRAHLDQSAEKFKQKEEEEAQAKADDEAWRRLKAQDRAKERRAVEGAEKGLVFLAEAEPLSDAFARPDEPQRWAVQDLLPEYGNASLTAPKKVGKTTMMNHLTRCLVDDRAFLGEYKVQPGRVAYFNYEVGPDQWTRWMREVGIVNAEEVFPLHLRGRSLNLRSEVVREKLVEWLATRGIDYLILDPGHRACVGYKSDDNDEVLEFTEALDAVKDEAGVRSIILPLHTGHGSTDRARGAARWGDWPDAIWTYEKTKDGGRSLEAEGRDVLLQPSMLFYDERHRDLYITDGPIPDSENRSIEDKILEFLANNPDVQAKKSDIGGRIGKGKQAAMQAADALQGLGKIHYVAGPYNAQILRLGPPDVGFAQLSSE